MTPFLWFESPVLALAADLLVRGAVILAIAGLLTVLLRGGSAALRHAVWTTALAALLAMPILTAMLPGWEVAVLPAEPDATSAAVPSQVHPSDVALAPGVPTVETDAATAAPAVAPPPPGAARQVASPAYTPEPDARGPVLAASARPFAVPTSPAFWFVVLWASGALVLLARLGIAHAGVRLLVRRSRPAPERLERLCARVAARAGLAPLELRLSAGIGIPVVAGCRNPVMLLPLDALEWSGERLSMVCAHELAHVARHDCATQLFGQVVCALSWMNPLVWHAVRQQLLEAERAADDFVLARGIRPSDYAGALVDLARHTRRLRWADVAALSAARKHHLEGRVRSILDPEINRTPMNRATFTLAILVCAAAVLPAITLQPVRAQPTPPAPPTPPPVAIPDPPAPPSEPARALLPDAPPAEPARDVEWGTPPPRPAQDAVLGTPPALPARDAIRTAPAAEPARDARPATPSPEPPANAKPAVPTEAPLEPGEWRGRFDRNGDRFHLRLSVDRRQTMSQTLPVSAFSGLDRNHEGYVDFQLDREAGSFSFTGTIEDGRGSGTFDFQSNSGYVARLEQRGFGDELDEDMRMALALHDVTLAFMDDLEGEGYGNIDLDEYLAMRIHGADASFARDMSRRGYDDLHVDRLIAFRIHGVTPEFMQGLADAGLRNLAADELIAFRIHGVTPSLVRELADAGYDDLDGDELVAMRIHGVDPAFLASARENGLGPVSVDDAVAMRIHGVSDEFVQELRDLGYEGIDSDDLVAMRIHGVTPEFIRDVSDRGYGRVDIDDLVAMRIHGVSPRFVADLEALGYRNVDIDELVAMRIHGVSADFIRQVKERGYDLSIDRLVAMRIHDVRPSDLARK